MWCALLLAGTVLAPPQDPEEALDAAIEAYLAPLLEHELLSGVVLVGGRDEVRFLEGYGLADDAAGEPNGPDTRFVIASLTKGMTAAGVLLLRDGGALDLDDPLSRFEPKFPRAEEITVRQLLLHRSGVGNPPRLDPFEHRVDLDGLVERIAAAPFLFDPGTDGGYSNSGYALLARVIERASDVPYAEFLAANVFEPLGMEASGDAAAERERELAVGYVPAPPPGHRRVPRRPDPGFLIGSGSVTSTARDLFAWARAVADDWPVDWLALEWPYGWGKVQVGGHAGLEQTGAVTGFMSVVIVLPEADTFVVVLLNQELGRWAQFGRGIATLAVGGDPDPIEIPAAVALTDAMRVLFVGTYDEAGETDGNTLHVEERDGHLWLRWNDWPVPKWLVPFGEDRCRIPADNGLLRFTEEALAWEFGPDSATVYTRRD